MIVDYKDSFEDGLTLTILGNNSVEIPCIVYKKGSYITSIVHVYDAGLDREIVWSVLGTRTAILYKNF